MHCSSFRYKILEETNNDLKRQSVFNSADLENSGKERQALLKNKQNDILVMNSSLARLMTKMEEVSSSMTLSDNMLLDGAELVREDGALEPLGDLDDAELFADSLFSA